MNLLDELTTQADNLYCEMAHEGKIENQETLLHFLDKLVTYLETIGGRVESMSYTDGRPKLKYAPERA
jgi:hypothetical protein